MSADDAATADAQTQPLEDARPLADLTGFRRDLLVVIDGLDEPSGLDISRVLEAEYGTEILSGRLYPNLESLGDKGLIGKGAADGRTNTYQISDRGQRELDAHRRWMGRAGGESR